MTKSLSGPQQLIIPAHESFSRELARQILKHHADCLPDLHHTHVILPNAQAVQQFRLSLTHLAESALIGGYCGSLSQWLETHIDLPGEPLKHISQSARQLLLIEALKLHPQLFAAENHWQVCDSLLTLFDELSLTPQQWLDEPAPQWIEQLQRAYQVDCEIQHLSQEATIIQTLWQAWQQQLAAMQLCDDTSALKLRLIQPLNQAFKDSYFYIVGAEQLTPLEQAWCEQLSLQSNVYYVQQGYLPDDIPDSENLHSSTQLLQDIFNHNEYFYSRCINYQQHTIDNPLKHIRLLDTQSAEQETRAIDLKIRSKLLEGKRNIAVVTENRKLARRLRALLERSGVNIQDTAGWALATTSAATLLERWLECIEQDFSHLPLLDLLKSPFFCEPQHREEHLQLVYRFEQDIVLHENIANDLQRYQRAIKYRSQRLNLHTQETTQRLLDLLNTIEQAANPLRKMFKSAESHTPDSWIDAFINSIKQLGIYSQLETDIAGMRVQQELDMLSGAHTAANPLMNWQDFRTWLGNTLEQEQFKPHGQNAAVKIMNMQQAQYCDFDTLIIAGANAESFPGKPAQLPFFNQSVRKALQLTNWQQQKAYQLYQFQQLLLSSTDILITWQSERNGEWMAASPWVSSIQNFFERALNFPASDHQLEYLLKHTQSLTHRDNDQLDNIHTTRRAQPQLKNALIPEEFSASRHQRLIDCPYKFFAADALKLKPLEQISTELMKSEYGEKVHLILQAFHQQVLDLPAPFPHSITLENRQEAIAHLEQLSETVFRSNMEDSVQHRGWLERWTRTVPAYIDWQIKRHKEWKIHQLELANKQQINDNITLTGRLDRVDIQQGKYAIIDYKTGNTASQDEIDSGENVQLINYAALMQGVSEVLYLKLDDGKVSEKASLQDESLTRLKLDCSERLHNILEDIHASSPLPAWGDTQSCIHCDMQGLCRKQIWEVNS